MGNLLFGDDSGTRGREQPAVQLSTYEGMSRSWTLDVCLRWLRRAASSPILRSTAGPPVRSGMISRGIISSVAELAAQFGFDV
jgi:hypothetical protein